MRQLQFWRQRTDEVVGYYLDSLQANRRAKATISWHASLLRRLARAYPQLPKRVEDLERFLGGMEIGAETHRDYVRILRQFYDWAMARGYAKVNPARSLPMPRSKRRVRPIFSPDDTRAMWRACRDDLERALLALVLDTGMRIGEVASLTIGSITPAGLVPDGKTGEHIVDADPTVISRLMALGNGDVIWTGKRGRLTASGLQQRWRQLCRRAGVKAGKIGPHTGRHTHATRALAKGEELGRVQERLGHARPSTTMLYIHVAERIRRDGAGRVSPLRELIGDEGVA